MKHITLQRNNTECYPDNVFIRHGFTRVDHDDVNIHLRFGSLGIVTAIGNSMQHWHKDGKVYLFDGWEEDEDGYMAKNPRFVIALDITDIVKEMGIYA